MPPVRRSLFARATRVVAAVSAAICLIGACSGSKHHAKGTSAPAPTALASGSAARASHLLTIGKINVQSAGRTTTLATRTQQAVLAAAQSYVDKAILTPLETGKTGHGYTGLFVPGLQAAAAGPDEHILTDLPVGQTSSLSESSSPVAISALADSTGALLYLATNFDVSVHATRASGAISIARQVELTFEPLGRAWRVVAYRVTVTRRSPARTKAPTASHPRPSRPPRRPATTTTRSSAGRGAA